MKQLIRNLVLFVIPLVVALIALEVTLRSIPNDYRNKTLYLEQHSNEIEVLVLGTSHTFLGINPKYIKQKCYNAANSNQPLDIDVAFLKKHENNWEKLKCLVVPVDYHTLFFRAKRELFSKYYLYQGIDLGGTFADRFEISATNFRVNCDRLIAYSEDHGSEITADSLGWFKMYTKHNPGDVTKGGPHPAKEHTFDLKDTLTLRHNLAMLDSIVAFSTRHKINIIFVTCPVYRTYTEDCNKTQLDLTIQTIRQLSSQVKHSTYYNLMEDPRYDRHDFFDPDHLNEIGATKFTRQIDSLIQLQKYY
jgi:hypothetical protein